MKRSLQVLGEARQEQAGATRYVRLGTKTVSIVDTGDGCDARRFTGALVEAGGVELPLEPSPHVDERIVIRAAETSAKLRLRAQTWEESADVVLGSPRPVFASLFAAACTDQASS